MRLVERRPVPVLEIAIALTVSEVIALELKGQSAYSSYFGSVTNSISVTRMWFVFVSKQLESDSNLEQTECQWSLVRWFLPNTEALRWFFVTCESILVSI